MSERASFENRVLALGLPRRDAELTRAILGRAGIDCAFCSAKELARESEAGVGAVLVAEESLVDTHLPLSDLVKRQPPWSDLPMLLLTSRGADSPAAMEAAANLGNVTLLERPIRVSALVSSVRTALRARQRQYQIRAYLAERLRSEETRARLAAIVESSEDAIIGMTLDGVIDSWNGGATQLYGYSATEAIGRPITFVVPPDKRGEEHSLLQEIRDGKTFPHYETVRISKHGRSIDVSLTVSPIRDDTGRIVGVSKIARDIGARKRAEEALRESGRRKDEFLATLAHELRNPLAPLRNALHLMRLDDALTGRMLSVMERQLEHLVRLVDDLFEASRITRGKIGLKRRTVDLIEVVRSAVETSQPLIDARRQRLEIELPAEPIAVDADPVRLCQVFANLLNNAAKFSKDDSSIWLTVEREGDEGVVTVRDEGIGIQSATLPRLFELFVQGDLSPGRAQSGLGIGLSLVKSIVEMHGGSVTAASEGRDRGSVFAVRLPLSSSLLASGVAPQRLRPFQGSAPRRVLIVDDNRDAADSLGTLLESLGAEVRIVYDGRAALETLEGYDPALVVLDIGMPGMDGYEVASRIRQQPRLRDVVLVALTGWGQEHDRQRGRKAGFDHHLIKPADLETLRGLLQTLGAKRERSRSDRR